MNAIRRPLLLVIFAGFLLGAVGGAAFLIFNTDMPRPRVTTTGTALIGGPFFCYIFRKRQIAGPG